MQRRADKTGAAVLDAPVFSAFFAFSYAGKNEHIPQILKTPETGKLSTGEKALNSKGQFPPAPQTI